MPEPPAPSPPSAPSDEAPEAALTPARAASALSFRRLALPLALSLGAGAVVIWATYEPGAFGTMRRSLRPGLLALAFVALAAQIVLGGLRLRLVSHGRISFRKGVRGQLTWDFLAGISPTIIGGGPIATLVLARENRLSIGEMTALALFIMLTDQLFFVGLIPVVLAETALLNVFPPGLGAFGASTLTTYLVGMMVWAGLFAYATLIRPELIERTANAVFRLRWLRRFAPRVGEELAQLRVQSRTLRAQPVGFFAAGVALAGGMWLCRYAVMLFVAWSVVPELPVAEFVFRSAALQLAAVSLPTPGGSGGVEGLYLLFLGPLLPEGFAGPTLLTWRLISYYLLLALGLGAASGSLRAILARRDGRPGPSPAA